MLKASNGGMWIQYTPGHEPIYVGCVDVEAITAPKGDSTPIMCHGEGEGEFVALGQSYAAPGNVTTTVKALVNLEKDVLDDWEGQLLNVYFMQFAKCDKRGIFTNYPKGLAMLQARITSDDDENVVMREGDDATTRSLAISAPPPKIRFRPVVVTRQTAAFAAAFNDIFFDPLLRNAGACGSYRAGCTDGFIACDPIGGATADMLRTADSGITWAATVDPFAAALAIMSGVRFDVDYGVKRTLVVRGTLAATPAACNYSDDDGATWQAAEVPIGATVTEAALTGASLFALDRSHIFFCTDGGAGGGKIYKSDNGGEAGSWTEIVVAALVGANNLFAIKFADHDVGLCVGAAGIIILTVDSGVNWALVADPSGGSDIVSCDIFNRYRFIVGTDDGEMWQTWDGGATWTECVFRGNGVAADTVKDIVHANDVALYMVHNATGVGHVHRSKDGGFNWERLDTPANAGLNAMYCCGTNSAWAVGEISAVNGVVLRVLG